MSAGTSKNMSGCPLNTCLQLPLNQGWAIKMSDRSFALFERAKERLSKRSLFCNERMSKKLLNRPFAMSKQATNRSIALLQ